MNHRRICLNAPWVVSWSKVYELVEYLSTSPTSWGQVESSTLRLVVCIHLLGIWRAKQSKLRVPPSTVTENEARTNSNPNHDNLTPAHPQGHLKCKEYSLQGVSPPSSPVSCGVMGVSTPNARDPRIIAILSRNTCSESATWPLIAAQCVKSAFHAR